MRSLLLVCALAAIAAAQPRDPKDLAYADQLTEAGLRAMKSGDHELAIANFEKAHALVPNVVFVWNIAKAHRLLAIALHDADPRAAADHRDKARARFREVLDAKPQKELYDRDPAAEVDMKRWLAELDQQATEAETARASEEQRKREETIASERTRAAEEAKRDDAARAALDNTKRARERSLRVRVGIAAGVGIVGIGAGVVSGLVAQNASNRLSSTTKFDPSLYSRGQTADAVMTVSYIASGAVLVGTAVAYWWFHRKINVLALPTAHGGEVGVHGRF